MSPGADLQTQMALLKSRKMWLVNVTEKALPPRRVISTDTRIKTSVWLFGDAFQPITLRSIDSNSNYLETFVFISIIFHHLACDICIILEL